MLPPSLLLAPSQQQRQYHCHCRHYHPVIEPSNKSRHESNANSMEMAPPTKPAVAAAAAPPPTGLSWPGPADTMRQEPAKQHNEQASKPASNAHSQKRAKKRDQKAKSSLKMCSLWRAFAIFSCKIGHFALQIAFICKQTRSIPSTLYLLTQALKAELNGLHFALTKCKICLVMCLKCKFPRNDTIIVNDR